MLTKVKLIDKLGSDKTVVNAARVSFNKEISEMKQELLRFKVKYNVKG